MNTPEVGKSYIVNSQRKGTFAGLVTAINEPFCDVLITSEKAEAMLEHNEREQGETVTVRMSFCKFTEVAL